jgi:hypothetical protein
MWIVPSQLPSTDWLKELLELRNSPSFFLLHFETKYKMISAGFINIVEKMLKAKEFFLSRSQLHIDNNKLTFLYTLLFNPMASRELRFYNGVLNSSLKEIWLFNRVGQMVEVLVPVQLPIHSHPPSAQVS